MKPIRNGEYCSYRCPYHLPGPVVNYCNLFNKTITYNEFKNGRPLAFKECKENDKKNS